MQGPYLTDTRVHGMLRFWLSNYAARVECMYMRYKIPKRILTRGAFSSILSTMSPMRSDRRSDSSSDSIRSRGHLMPASYCAL